MPETSIIVTTTNEVSGTRIVAYLGVVRGLIVRTPNIGATILGGLKSLMGGNISQFSKVCEVARQEAFDLMVEHARELGADAIIGMHYDATEFAQGATEVLAYGTAVKLAR